MTTVCVIGLGRIGLSLALLLANAKHRVFGFDTDQQIVPRILSAGDMEQNTAEEKELLRDLLNKSLFVVRDLSEAISGRLEKRFS